MFLIFSGIFLPATSFGAEGESRMFTITGYYSPLPSQPYFLTGSYESEIRLNGRGKFGADGTPVYPGMIAAPKTYAFGTKICLPSFGCGTVHDRGGAIVEKGKRNLAKHDRLDLWLGYGEEGLRRALSWGVQHMKGTLYDKNANIADSVNFSAPLPLHQLIDFPDYPNFPENLALGDSGASVKALQEGLYDLGLYREANHGRFDEATRDALYTFQRKYFIVNSNQEAGAGRFGPKTREKFTQTLYQHQIQKTIEKKWAEFTFETNQKRGKRNADTVRLQEILIKEELLHVLPTGFFGPLTEEALTQFQLKHDIIVSENQIGAGQLGPKTRVFLNTQIEEENQEKSQEKNEILAFQKVKNTFHSFAGIEKNSQTLVFTD